MGKKPFHCFLLDGTRHRSEPFHAFGDNNTSCEATMTFQKSCGPYSISFEMNMNICNFTNSKIAQNKTYRILLFFFCVS